MILDWLGWINPSRHLQEHLLSQCKSIQVLTQYRLAVSSLGMWPSAWRRRLGWFSMSYTYCSLTAAAILPKPVNIPSEITVAVKLKARLPRTLPTHWWQGHSLLPIGAGRVGSTQAERSETKGDSGVRAAHTIRRKMDRLFYPTPR